MSTHRRDSRVCYNGAEVHVQRKWTTFARNLKREEEDTRQFRADMRTLLGAKRKDEKGEDMNCRE